MPLTAALFLRHHQTDLPEPERNPIKLLKRIWQHQHQ